MDGGEKRQAESNGGEKPGVDVSKDENVTTNDQIDENLAKTGTEPAGIPNDTELKVDDEEETAVAANEEDLTPIDVEKQQENLEKQILHSLISLLMKVTSFYRLPILYYLRF